MTGNVTNVGGGGAVVGALVILAAVVAAVVALASAAAAIVGVGAVLGLSAAAVHVADQTAAGIARRRREALDHRRAVELAEASRPVIVMGDPIALPASSPLEASRGRVIAGGEES